MLGAIIGDIVGSRFEFCPTSDYHFDLFTPDCGFTDDTICTIAVADAILHGHQSYDGHLPYGEYIHRWCRRYPNPMGGYGQRFAQWVKSDNPLPYNSFGNGSAMRVSPIAWVADTYAEAIMQARRSAECTHSHPEGLKGAEAVATVIFNCLKKHREGQLQTQEDIEPCLYLGQLLYPGSESLRLEDYRNRFDETCQGTVPVAFKIIEESSSFEDAIRRAVSLGADADTLGAIVGSIAEAIWGIPEDIEKQALRYLPQEMIDVLTAFRALVAEREQQLQQQQAAEQQAATPGIDSLQSMMQWKLAWWHSANPEREAATLPPATADCWQTEPMPEDNISDIRMHHPLSREQMQHLRLGHVPDCQEDHWFMYTDDTHIHIFRSWTGMCAFRARYRHEGDHYTIDHLIINHALCDFGVNGDDSAVALFRYLLTAATCGDDNQAWADYLNAWLTTHDKQTTIN